MYLHFIYNRTLQHCNENIVNNTGNNNPAPDQQNEHQQISMINHAMQELRDTDALKEKLKNIFDHNYQYYVKRKLKDRVIPMKPNKKIELNILKNPNEIAVRTYSQLRTSQLKKLTVQSMA